ncbi:hypothetical protein DRB96_34745 [Streptomyces sp. ICC1]|nr:hypothetical protein DRB96_34745 [Streptomyces sp. ICC1]
MPRRPGAGHRRARLGARQRPGGAQRGRPGPGRGGRVGGGTGGGAPPRHGVRRPADVGRPPLRRPGPAAAAHRRRPGRLAVAGVGGLAHADAEAGGRAERSPGVLSGNLVQLPVHTPVSASGSGPPDPSSGRRCWR